ncbi:MAG: hypothetical protein IMF11_19185 [Proteobacteria bacterium]|nr:hypothetical protein [Pseudomonadota bacterium]
MKVNTRGYEGRFGKTARVHTSDPGNRVVRIGITALVKVSVSVSPKSVYFGGLAGDTIERTVTIKARKTIPLSLKPVEFSLSGKVDYKIETVEEGRRFRIIFRNKSIAEERYCGFLKLQTNYPDKPVIIIQIMGNIRIKKEGTQGRDRGV